MEVENEETLNNIDYDNLTEKSLEVLTICLDFFCQEQIEVPENFFLEKSSQPVLYILEKCNNISPETIKFLFCLKDLVNYISLIFPDISDEELTECMELSYDIMRSIYWSEYSERSCVKKFVIEKLLDEIDDPNDEKLQDFFQNYSITDDDILSVFSNHDNFELLWERFISEISLIQAETLKQLKIDGNFHFAIKLSEMLEDSDESEEDY